MTVELTKEEAQILIAVLIFAEGVSAETNPAMVEALKGLRSWRTALMLSFMRMHAHD